MVYGGHCYWIYAVCDEKIWRHIHVCKATFWWSLLTQDAYSGTSEQRQGRGPVKELRAMETCKKQKIVTKYVCFYSSTMLTSKTITEFIENHSNFSWYPNTCNKFVSSQSWYTMKLPMILLWKVVVSEVEVRGVQVHPKSFDLLKSWENLRKSEYKWRPALFHFKKWHPRFAVKHMKTFFGGHTKKRSSWSLWEEICRQNCTKTFRANLGKFWQKSFAFPTNCLFLHLWWKGTSVYIVPFRKGRG